MGQSGSKAVTSRDRAVLDMKVQRDKLRQYQKRIQLVLDREYAIAKTCMAAGQKDKAMLALRQRKYQEGLLEKTDQQLATLEQLTSSIEFALVEKDVLYGLQQGNQVLRAINKEMSLEKVEKLLDETADAVAYQQEVTEALSHRISHADEEEALAEYEELLAQLNPLPSMPDAPLKVILPETPDHDMPVPQAASRQNALAS